MSKKKVLSLILGAMLAATAMVTLAGCNGTKTTSSATTSSATSSSVSSTVTSKAASSAVSSTASSQATSSAAASSAVESQETSSTSSTASQTGMANPMLDYGTDLTAANQEAGTNLQLWPVSQYHVYVIETTPKIVEVQIPKDDTNTIDIRCANAAADISGYYPSATAVTETVTLDNGVQFTVISEDGLDKVATITASNGTFSIYSATGETRANMLSYMKSLAEANTPHLGA